MQMQLSPGTSNCILKSEEWKRAAGMNEAELRVHAPFVAKMNGLLSDKQTPEEWAKASLSDNSVSSDNSVASQPSYREPARGHWWIARRRGATQSISDLPVRQPATFCLC